MRLRPLITTVTAIVILGAITASAASANNVTLPTRWIVNGVPLPVGGAANIKCSVHEHEGVGNKLVLHGEVGEGGTKVKKTLTITGVECINHEGVSQGNGSGRIEQTGNPFKAEDFLRFVFTGVTVSEPPHCRVPGGTITTNPLKSTILHDAANKKIIFKRFESTTANIATIKTESDGTGECATAGNRILKGALCGKWENETGVLAVNQPLTFSAATTETIGNIEDSCELVMAGNPADLTGTINTELAAAKSGEKWGAEEG